MSYGITPTGFAIKPMAQIVLELQQAYQGVFGAGIPLDAGSLYGQLIGIHAERESDLWQVLQDTYINGFPDSANDGSLDSAISLVGAGRLLQTFSTVAIAVTGTATTIIPAGSQVLVTGTNAVFVTTGDITIAAGGTATGNARSSLPGPVPAPAGTLTVINTPVAGWATVTNTLMATLGRFVETNAAVKARRALSFVVAVGGPIAAVQNAVSKVVGVTFAGVKENRTGTVDAFGRSPYSFETVVIGGLDQSVSDAIWAAKSAGLAMYGTYTPQTTFDSFGNPQTVLFTRGVNVPMFLDVTITRGALYPSDGDAQVNAALALFINGLAYGQSVFNWQLIAALGGIPGIVTVLIKQDRAPTPTLSANTAINGNEKATQAAANIIVR
jgi:uncharacterized phage protein gp47/JayE